MQCCRLLLPRVTSWPTGSKPAHDVCMTCRRDDPEQCGQPASAARLSAAAGGAPGGCSSSRGASSIASRGGSGSRRWQRGGDAQPSAWLTPVHQFRLAAGAPSSCAHAVQVWLTHPFCSAGASPPVSRLAPLNPMNTLITCTGIASCAAARAGEGSHHHCVEVEVGGRRHCQCLWCVGGMGGKRGRA